MYCPLKRIGYINVIKTLIRVLGAKVKRENTCLEVQDPKFKPQYCQKQTKALICWCSVGFADIVLNGYSKILGVLQ
jgi:hypothetical protein